jgi:hypothetical protein
MKKILIPTYTPPTNYENTWSRNRLILNEIKKLEEIEETFVVFQPSKIFDDSKKFKIINFSDFNNAIEIIDKVKPDAILVDLTLELQLLPFVLGGKFRKIPVFSQVREERKDSKKIIQKISEIKIMINIVTTKKNLGNKIQEKNNTRINRIKFLFKELYFLTNTFSIINPGIKNRIKFLVFYLMKRFSAYFPIDKISSGDIIFCINDDWKEFLIKKEFDSEKIFMTGNPYYDEVYQQIEKFEKNYEENIIKKKILFCPSSLYEHGYISKKESDILIINTVNKILEIPNVDLKIKIHPLNSSFEHYTELSKKFKKKVIIYQNENIFSLINDCHVLISSAITRAIILGVLSKKNTINLKYFYPNLDYTYFDDDTVITNCQKINELEEKIKYALGREISKKDYETYIKKNIGKYDGKCANRIATKMIEIMSKNKKK